MNTSLLQQELEPLNIRIEEIRGALRGLEGEMREVEAELEAFAADRQRFDALREVCSALERLEELKARDLFWEGLPEADAASHLERLQGRFAGFDAEIRGTEERRSALQARIDRHLDDLDDLHYEVEQAHAREERRQEEFVIEREATPLPFRRMVMPWTSDAENERVFRRSLLVALLLSFVFGSVIPMVTVPVPDRMEVVEIPKRLARLVKKEPPRPEPVAQAKPEPEPERPLDKTKPKPEPEKPKKRVAKKQPKPTTTAGKAARKKAESTGVLAFKDTFADLVEDTPVAKLGAEARVSKEASQAKGQAHRPQRSLVAMQARGSGSGGIANAAVSRNVGNGNVDRLGGDGVGFERVESAVAGLAQEASRPLSDGIGPARTDEEIQIVFDRYKATLYRIYNTELRKDPTLRGKILLKISIEPDGSVSLCKVESTDLGSEVLVGKIVARVERFNFGPKEDVPKVTILYPIDFLPAS